MSDHDKREERLLRENRQLAGDLPVLELLAEFRLPDSGEQQTASTLPERPLLEDSLPAHADPTPPHGAADSVIDLTLGGGSRQRQGIADEGEWDVHWNQQGELQRWGRFLVQRKIGEGGFGIVFLATDPSLGRDVALKLPRVTALASREGRERFLREMRVAGTLDHPHIAPVFEAGTSGSTCYSAAPYYRGGSLADALKNSQPLETAEAARIVGVLAGALHFAHSRGILHRDLKPANVLLDSEHAGLPPVAANVKLTDFGLARVLWEESEQTQSGALLGTPSYMAPEQAESRLSEISTASDTYALGAILYELITGQPPFTGDNPLAVLKAVRTREPVPPRRLRPEIPRDLQAICLKCLEKLPQRRYTSAAALGEDLERWLAGIPVQARPVSAANRFCRSAMRNPVLTAAWLSAIFVLLAGTITSTTLWRSAAVNAERAELRSRQLSTAVSNLNSAVEMLLVTVAESDELRGSDAETLRKKLLDQAQQYYQLIAAQQPLEIEPLAKRAETLFLLGLVHKQLGDALQAHEIVTEAIDVAGSLPASDAGQIQLGEWHRRHAEILDKLGRPTEAKQARDAALTQLNAVPAPTSVQQRQIALTRAMVWADTASGHLVESQLPAAIEAATRSQELWQELDLNAAGPLSDRSLLGYATSYWVMGTALEESDQPAAAEQQHRKARQILLDNDVGPARIDLYLLLGRVTKKLGISVAKQNRLDEARQLYEAAIACFTELVTLHPQAPEYAMELCSSRYSLSVTEYLAGFPQRTSELVRENTETYEELASRYPDRAFEYFNRAGVSWNMLGTVHREQKQFEQASEALENSLRCYEAAANLRPNWTFNQIVAAEAELNRARIWYQTDGPSTGLEQLAEIRLRIEPIAIDQPQNQRAASVYADTLDLSAEWSLEVGDLLAASAANRAILELRESRHHAKAEKRANEIEKQRNKRGPNDAP